MTDQAEPERIRMTRQQLYDAVWTEPMQRLATRFGLSDVALAKRCHGLNIPVPPRGFWARKAAGQRVRNTPLPQATASQAAAVVMFDPQSTTAAPAEPQEGPIWEQTQFEAQPENKIVIRDRLSRHPLIHTAALVARGRASSAEIDVAIAKHGLLSIGVTQPQLARALRYMDAFVAACERRGFTVVGWRRNGADSHVLVLGQKIELRIREPERRIELAPPAGVDPSSHFLYPRSRLEGTGLLELQLGERYSEFRRTWKDGKRTRLEDSLHDIMIALVRIAVQLRDRTERWRLEEQRRFEVAERERLERTERELQQKRFEQLLADARSWRLAEELRGFLNAVEARLSTLATASDSDPAWSDWLKWARATADRIDPLLATDLLAHLRRAPG